VRLRYIGTSQISFQSLGLTVEPGEEFDAPDEVAEGYTRRADVEAVKAPTEPKPVKKAAAGKAATAPAADPEPAAAEPEPATTKEA